MAEQSPRGRLVVLVGPSGVGKDTVIRELLRLRPWMRRPPAVTTRPPRPAEHDGDDYRFVDAATFAGLAERGSFLETALVHENRYGTPRAAVEGLLAEGREVLLKPDVQGASQLRRAGVEGLYVFLAPPSREALRERLLARGTETEEELRIRLRDQQHELSEQRSYRHVVVNDEVERAAREISEIISRTGG